MCMYYVICILPMHFWPTVNYWMNIEYNVNIMYWGYLYSKNVTGPLSSCCCRQEYQLFFLYSRHYGQVKLPCTMYRNSYLFSKFRSNMERQGSENGFFSGWVIKNVELTVRLFYVKPCKKLFSDRNLCILHEQGWRNDFILGTPLRMQIFSKKILIKPLILG